MAIWSKGTPRSAAAEMRRAISTHSSASPEVEKIATERSSSRGGTGSAGEEIALERFQGRCGRERAGREAQIETSACRAHQGAEEVALQLRPRREIQGDDGHLAKVARAGGYSFARQSDAVGMIGETARGKLARVGIEQARKVGAGLAAIGQAVEARRVQAKLFEGVRKRAGKPGKPATGAR